MTVGKGNYDELASYVREKTDADMVCLIIIGGNKGPGFSVQVTDPLLLRKLPEFLFDVATQIGADIEKDIANPGKPRPWS